MAAALESLVAMERALATALIVITAAAVAAALVCTLVAACPGYWIRWRHRRAQRRYVRGGLRELEHYLAATPRRRPR